MIDLERDVDKRKRVNCKDFPPTFEDEQIRMWDNTKLNLNKEEAMPTEEEKQWTMPVDFEKEEMHEIRVYPMFNRKLPEKFKDVLFEEMKKDGVAKEDIENMRKAQDEPLSEEYYLEGFDLKIISKIDKKTKELTVMLKGHNIITPKQKMDKEEYDRLVSTFETSKEMHYVYDINAVRIMDSKYFRDMLKKSGMEEKIKE